MEQKASTVCIDESKGRRAALAVGLSVTGSLGLLGRAKVLGLIPSLRPLIERATREGIYYDPELAKRVLVALGE